jgi:hypothetical protein
LKVALELEKIRTKSSERHLNPHRLGADHARRVLYDKLVSKHAGKKTWLPNFGRTFVDGPRRISREEFLKTMRFGSKMGKKE